MKTENKILEFIGVYITRTVFQKTKYKVSELGPPLPKGRSSLAQRGAPGLAAQPVIFSTSHRSLGKVVSGVFMWQNGRSGVESSPGWMVTSSVAINHGARSQVELVEGSARGLFLLWASV